ncbi:MAG: hypothetical protein GXP29_02715 [Planctomycetes bacterium]|nr:hypothetical protein [Planctomycetota bacterium]
MKRNRLIQTFVVLFALCVTTDCALAIAGPLEFSFATGFFNNIFLLPFRLAGCG